MRLPRWFRPTRQEAIEREDVPASPLPDVAVFKTLMFTATEIAKENAAALPALISAILRPEQSELILGVAEHGQDAKTELSGFTFFVDDVRDHFPEADRTPVEPLGPYPLHLARDAILPCPWADSRFINAMAFIGSTKLDPVTAARKGYGGRWTPRAENHHVFLWLPWRIGFVGGGNHSIAAGIVAGEGILMPDRVDDFSCLLDLMETDGITYYDRRTKAHVAPVTDARHAAVFEIGRLIVEAATR